MKILLRILWIIIAIGAAMLIWWFAYGPWQNAGVSLASHDAVRFGPIPMYSSMVWCALVIITILVARFKKNYGDSILNYLIIIPQKGGGEVFC